MGDVFHVDSDIQYCDISIVAVVFEATRHIIKLYDHRRRKNKKNGRGATLIIRKEMAEHVSSTMHVFRGEKYRLLLRGGPTHRKGNGQKYNLTVNATVTDP